MSSLPAIVVASEDRTRLLHLVAIADENEVTELLADELERARVCRSTKFRATSSS